MSIDQTVALGVFGGSGFYEFLDGAEDIHITTPYGAPAGPVAVGFVGDHRVAFMPRHGREHGFAAHRVPYRANVWAMHALGVRSLIAPCSVGSLQPDIHPGNIVVIDQLVDRTWGRPDTFHDVGAPATEPAAAGPVHHQSFADPYDEGMRAALVAAGRRTGADVVAGGTMVVINGPRFSTRAESAWFRSNGWHVVNMTGYPESVLAAELGVRYAGLALVTDYDAGVDGHAPVTMNEVFAVMSANVASVRDIIVSAIEHSYGQLVADG
ncbi:MAG: S-methyl-5'-thioadenosine phosphorylase [Actinomycetota bacterium]|jgi:5'-methylthioadenosine phosphorylase|nr:MAG: 5'-methylthioadenosine phosphorylase [Acidimicrobiaceae bacterium]